MIARLLTCLSLCIPASLFAQDAAMTPSGPIYTKQNPQLELISLKTYDRPPNEQWAFAIQQFPRLVTTYIYAEVNFKNLLYNVQEQQYILTFKWFLENGQQLGESASTPFLVQMDRQNAWMYDSQGWSEPGNWPLGTHRVEVWVNDTKFAVRNFTIVSASMEE